MRRDILNGDLKPGARLRMQSLGERYNVGNSPIREALNRLAVERLITREDQKGFSVPHISAGEAAELVKTRCWLEAIAVRESVLNATPKWEEKLVLAYHRLSRTPRSENPEKFRSNPKWKELHYEFHMALIENCGSRWLYTYCEQLFALAERYRNASMSRIYTQRNSDEEHRAILNAAVDRNADESVRLMREHIQKTTDVIIEDDESAS
jgi:DNA-binding GntR family transcriptional regulator